VPLLLARVLLGLVYFFPGLHKLRVSGFGWMTAENVTNHMHAKWLEHGTIPSIRIDHAPVLCTLGAIGVVAFELAFVFLAVRSSKTRWVALGLGLAFHAMTEAFFFIRFTSLLACYVVLLDGGLLERIDARFRKKSGSASEERSVRATLVVAAPLVLAVIIQGVRGQTQAWPIACYPTFEHVQGPTIPDLALTFEKTDGSRVVLTGRERRPRDQVAWGHVFRISGAYGDPPNEAALRAHARLVMKGAEIDPAAVLRVHVERVEVPTTPERWTEPPATGTGTPLSVLEPPL